MEDGQAVWELDNFCVLLFSFFPLAWTMCLFVCVFLILPFLHCCFGFFFYAGKVALEKFPELVLEENIMIRMQIPDGDVHAVLFQEHTTA